MVRWVWRALQRCRGVVDVGDEAGAVCHVGGAVGAVGVVREWNGVHQSGFRSHRCGHGRHELWAWYRMRSRSQWGKWQRCWG